MEIQVSKNILVTIVKAEFEPVKVEIVLTDMEQLVSFKQCMLGWDEDLYTTLQDIQDERS